MARIVIALGGNALGNTPEEQLEKVANAAKSIVEFVKQGHDVIIGHGNGPQVGMINNAMDFSSKNGGKTPAMPFPECGAMSQGYIGYHLQNAILREETKQGINKNVVTVDFYDWLQKKIPSVQNFQFIYDPTESYSVSSDFTIVLAEQ